MHNLRTHHHPSMYIYAGLDFCLIPFHHRLQILPFSRKILSAFSPLGPSSGLSQFQASLTMEDKKQPSGSSSSSSSSSMTLDHLFGPKDSSSSSTTGLFASIFPPPPAVLERERKIQNQGDNGRYANPAEPSYLSSSIYYGGQENYSPRTKPTESRHNVKKEPKEEDDSNGRDSNCASRGNWWQGSLYY